MCSFDVIRAAVDESFCFSRHTVRLINRDRSHPNKEKRSRGSLISPRAVRVRRQPRLVSGHATRGWTSSLVEGAHGIEGREESGGQGNALSRGG
jgi:hypothetical protein